MLFISLYMNGFIKTDSFEFFIRFGTSCSYRAGEEEAGAAALAMLFV
jgi:hypothetical protein